MKSRLDLELFVEWKLKTSEQEGEREREKRVALNDIVIYHL